MFFTGKCFAFLFFLSTLFNPLRLEAGGLSFTVDPSKIRLIISGGGSQAGTIKVSSQSNDKVKIKVYLEDWVYSKIQDGTKVFSPAKNTPLSCSDWVTFSPAEFTLMPFGEQNINYIMRVPANAKGGYYSAMFFETALLNEEENALTFEVSGPGELRTGAILNLRIGILFYVEAKDTIRRLAELTNLSVSNDLKNRQLVVTSDFKNTGNVDITAGGSFHIIDKQGMVLARSEFDKVYTFPGDTARLTASCKDTIPKGKYDLILTVDLGKALEELSMGRGPVVTQETEIEVSTGGEIIKVGELK